jgi:phosphomannomutase / phosphoglucomutase
MRGVSRTFSGSEGLRDDPIRRRAITMSLDSPRVLFGTDGIRKVVGDDLTPVFIARVISAYSKWVGGRGPVVVAHDFRTSSDGLARICAGTLQMNGVDVIEAGVMPTPCLQFNVPALSARAGLMVTASHNPTEFNGIKFCGPRGLEIPPDAEQLIEDAFEKGLHRFSKWDEMGRIATDPGSVDRYLRSIESNVDQPRIRKAGLRVVLDCGNGTSAVTSPMLLHAGLGCPLTTLNANPDGAFSGHPSEPTAENLAHLQRMVPATGAVLGIAHDGDSDRVAFVDELGRYVPGETALALFARHTLRENPGATIVTSITSSSAIADVVAAEEGKLVVTRSGSLPVAEGVETHHAVFGGEENGHFYWPHHQNAPDGPMSSAKIVDLLVREGRPLSRLIFDLPAYAVIKKSVPLPPNVREIVMQRAGEILAREALRTVTIDGVKAFYSDGWVLVRPSGTEPICRIFSESADAESAARLNHRGVEIIARLIREASARG